MGMTFPDANLFITSFDWLSMALNLKDIKIHVSYFLPGVLEKNILSLTNSKIYFVVSLFYFY